MTAHFCCKESRIVPLPLVDLANQLWELDFSRLSALYDAITEGDSQFQSAKHVNSVNPKGSVPRASPPTTHGMRHPHFLWLM